MEPGLVIAAELGVCGSPQLASIVYNGPRFSVGVAVEGGVEEWDGAGVGKEGGA